MPPSAIAPRTPASGATGRPGFAIDDLRMVAARSWHWFGTLAAFVAGALIAVPLFDLLPEALELGAESNILPRNVMYVVALGH